MNMELKIRPEIMISEHLVKYVKDIRKTILGTDFARYKFCFDNRYGASVVKGEGTYGASADLWELALLSCKDTGEWEIDYTHDITGFGIGTVGFLTDEEVARLLFRIMNGDIDDDQKALDRMLFLENGFNEELMAKVPITINDVLSTLYSPDERRKMECAWEQLFASKKDTTK